MHAVVRRAGGSLLVTPASPHVTLLLNNVTVPSGGSNLADGDRLIVGSTRLVVRRHR